MAKSYYSTVFDQTADEVWGIVRDFGNDYWWTHEPVKTVVEDGKSGYEIGAIRHVRGAGFNFRQRLVAISDTSRFAGWLELLRDILRQQKPRARRQRSGREALPSGWRAPDIVRARALARARTPVAK